MFLKLAFLLVLGLAFQKVYADEPERIVGGSNAYPGELPYQVSLRVDGNHVCGGSIVSNSHIITAAHCVVNVVKKVVNPPFNNLRVVTGSVILRTGGQFHRVKDVRIHPNYKPSRASSWENDIALIYLAEPIKFNGYQKPIPLATSSPPDNAPLTVSGWGRLAANKPGAPYILKKATLNYVDNVKCQNVFLRMTIHSTQICALRRSGIGACNGDSGGPLVYQGELVGIVSWVRRCAVGVPDVFTRVSDFHDFLRDIRDL